MCVCVCVCGCLVCVCVCVFPCLWVRFYSVGVFVDEWVSPCLFVCVCPSVVKHRLRWSYLPDFFTCYVACGISTGTGHLVLERLGFTGYQGRALENLFDKKYLRPLIHFEK